MYASEDQNFNTHPVQILLRDPSPRPQPCSMPASSALRLLQAVLAPPLWREPPGTVGCILVSDLLGEIEPSNLQAPKSANKDH